MTDIDRERLRKYLPYGDSFLFVDAVLECNDNTNIRTVMHYDLSHTLIAAHTLNGRSIVPGTILIEQVAQSGLLMLLLSEESERASPPVLSIVNCRLLLPAVAPCSVQADVSLLYKGMDAYRLKATATIGGSRILLADLTAVRLRNQAAGSR